MRKEEEKTRMVAMETTWGQGRISLSKMGETQACSWAEGKEPWERSEIRRE